MTKSVWSAIGALIVLAALAACGPMESKTAADAGSPSGVGAPGASGRGPGGPAGGARPGGFGGPAAGGGSAAIPVRVAPVERRAISQFLETNGTVESDNDVALVARTSGPIVELRAEEGMRVEQGQLLARIDDDEIRARLELAKVNLGEAELANERAKAQYENQILSRELFDQAASKLEAARAQVRENEVQLAYTSIKAPFRGMIVERYVKFAEHVQNNTPLFRISDFDPLQCPIQVPEKDLARLEVRQPAYLTVEAFPGERFEARVLRVSPVVDSATGTVKVTLEVETRGRLRPGMFASVFLETDRHADALVIPKRSLVLESIGDTVYVKDGDAARRREVRLGFDEGDHVEVLAGLEQGQEVVILGQDSLSDGTPIYILEPGAAPPAAGAPSAAATSAGAPTAGTAGRFGGEGARGGPPPFDPAKMTPEMLETIKERMRARGLSDQDIERRIEAIKRGESPLGGPPGGGAPGFPGGGSGRSPG
jgi:membrane fusion protein (multidrug efflux system)